jgi:hypothetical protein
MLSLELIKVCKLYIIGNGFDLHHGLATRYNDFEQFLKASNRELLDNLYRYYFLEQGQDLWSNFEENLANLDKDSLLESFTNYLPVISSDDFREGDRYAFAMELKKLIGHLTNDLRKCFGQFILTAATKKIDQSSLLNIDSNSKFISFNYTRTLENEYGVHENSICYIHGLADIEEDIILGHALDPELFNEEIKDKSPPNNISDEQLELWHEEMSNQHDPSYESGVHEVPQYFKASFKDTKSIIDDNSYIFSTLIDIEAIHIFGHSMSNIDMPYFEKISNAIKPNCQWHVSYYCINEKEHIIRTLEQLNIKPELYNLFKLTDICVINQRANIE